jgi:hypothetical protein
MLIKNNSSADNIESESLAAHVKICSHRIASIEKKITEIETAATQSKMFFIKSIGVITAVLSTIITLVHFILERVR